MSSVNELFDLSGRVAVVTGGAGHLGTAMSEALHEAGAHVAVASRSEDKCRELAGRLSEKGPRCMGLGLDTTDESSMFRAVEQIASEFGRIDALVNNAYSARSHRNPEDVPVDVFEYALHNNVVAYYCMFKACLPHLRASGKGSVVNIASMYGMVCPHFDIYRDSPYFSEIPYHATKGGVLQITRYMAGYFARSGIRVNAISPGAFPKDSIRAEAPWFEEELSKQNPMNRVGVPDELKGAVVFLASDAASYVTGHNLVVDGGWTMW
jgi:gluconate 5-dehydrogenase